MQKGIGDDLPKAEIHVAVDGLQRPERKRYLELAIGRKLQQVHRDVGGDEHVDCG